MIAVLLQGRIKAVARCGLTTVPFSTCILGVPKPRFHPSRSPSLQLSPQRVLNLGERTTPSSPEFTTLATLAGSDAFILSLQPNLAPIRINRPRTEPPTFGVFCLTGDALKNNRVVLEFDHFSGLLVDDLFNPCEDPVRLFAKRN